jgi:hypothetical protein
MLGSNNAQSEVRMQLLDVGASNRANRRSQSRRRRVGFAKSWTALLIACATGIWLCFTIAFAWALSSKSGALGSFGNPTDSIRILSIFSEGVSVLLPALVASTSLMAMWATASSKKGTTVATWLSMSPATGPTSLPSLFMWPHLSRARDWHRPWIIVRFGASAKI